MQEQIKLLQFLLILFIPGFIFFWSVLLMGIPSKKFQVSDCIAMKIPGNEFEPEQISSLKYKVIKVGKKGYLLESIKDKYTLYSNFNGQEIYTKVNCNE